MIVTPKLMELSDTIIMEFTPETEFETTLLVQLRGRIATVVEGSRDEFQIYLINKRQAEKKHA